jgi:hypothetical protein
VGQAVRAFWSGVEEQNLVRFHKKTANPPLVFIASTRRPSKKPSSRIMVPHDGQVEPTANLPMFVQFPLGQVLSFVWRFACTYSADLI